MWFRQAQLFQLSDRIHFSPEHFTNHLSQFEFSPCLPSMPQSAGWVSPHTDEENATLFRALNDRIMLCLQMEEKLLPNSVIRQYLHDKIKQIEMKDARKVRMSEKNSLKDEIIMTLLPRAFSRLHRVYAYIDLKQQWLIVGSTQAKQVTQFIAIFQKTFGKNGLPIKVEGLAARMTHWLKHHDYPAALAIDKACLLQDPENTARTIRCQQQDLNVEGIQALLQTGCHIKQLRLIWNDQIHFTLLDPFALQSIRFQDEIIARSKEMEPETAEQQFDADFFVMSEMISQLMNDLMKICAEKTTANVAAA